MALSIVLFFCGCDWIFGPDQNPPVCIITSPADSSIVSGLVDFRAEAIDTNDVTCVEFYADGDFIGGDSTENYGKKWDTNNLGEGTWHWLFCIAYDPSGNKGYSDTVNVQVVQGRQQDIFHGQFELPNGYYWSVEFQAEPSDTMSGQARVVNTGILSQFIWLDEDNYRNFQEGRSYTPLFQADNIVELSVHETVTTSGSFYLVFVNTSGSAIICWARFTLDK
ncbi:hypothetical protein CH330_06835 [candidate division WOR-3 bacterium JGI_Cruoil_03_51_56]|uniref:Uncharacterized protein n=1 Tax=candidate division WOR-3 bacterium JGI_Cruoil_03_51_56 TaxID=1973747 RepID=A0A235BRC3_UNCW3|nr:MAG: hypothetical protein CH330_06835 [candidate division WOR-3 bacterium JGI_Cruoil_03_51_56]